MTNSNQLYRLSSVVFFLSGCSALIFETIWFKVTSTVLGSSIWSAAAVLMAFMTGLGIGNAIIAFRGYQIKKPVALYIKIEIIIALSGLAAVYVLPIISYFIGSNLTNIVASPSALNLIRFSIAFLVLLIPAIAMGCTLPVLQKALENEDISFTKSIAHLYGWNTFGAVAGTLLSEFFLIQWLGIKVTALIAVLFNVSAALILYSKFSGIFPDSPIQAKPKSFIMHKRLLLAPALAGMLLLSLEVIWFRYLVLVQIETSTLFSLMLAIVLIGIACGGTIVSKSKISEKNIDLSLPSLAILAAITTVLGLIFFQLIYANFFWELKSSLPLFILSSVVLMFPTCLISGMLFPLFGEKLHETLSENTQSAGALTLANTFGAALGSGLATFLLLPVFGIEISILIISLTYLAIALISFLLSTKKINIKFSVPVTTLAAIFILLIFPFGGILNSYKIFNKLALPNEQLVSIKESLYATLQYYKKEKMGAAESYRLVTNGYSMSGTNFSGERYMKLFAYLPQILQGDINDALLISYGVGNTAEGITQLDTLTHLDIVDVSQDIIDLSIPAHKEISYDPLDDERTEVHIEDGRFFLKTTDKKYDLITGEPPPPKNPFIVNLYSQEFFQLSKDHLKPDGVISYWLPVHDLLASDSASIIKAFCNVYPECSLWNGYDLDFILIGSKSGLPPLKMDKIQEYWADPNFNQQLTRIGIENPYLLGSLFLAGPEQLKEMTESAQAVTDNYPQRISPSTQGMRERHPFYSSLLNMEKRSQRFAQSDYIQTLFPAEFIEGTQTFFEVQKFFLMGNQNVHVDFPLPYFWDGLSNLLAFSEFKTIPLLLLDGSPRELEILAKNSDFENPEHQLANIKKLIISREFEESASAIEEFLEHDLSELQVEYYGKLWVVVKGLAGNTALNALTETSSFQRYDEEFKQWFVEKFT